MAVCVLYNGVTQAIIKSIKPKSTKENSKAIINMTLQFVVIGSNIAKHSPPINKTEDTKSCIDINFTQKFNHFICLVIYRTIST